MQKNRHHMIDFKYPEERDIVYFFAGKLQDTYAAEILANETPLDEATALYLSEFFWRMVDSSIECESNKNYPWSDRAEFWNEKIIHSISGYLERSGFIDIWDEVIDRQ